MKEEAVKAGYYESPAGASCAKMQILTIRGLLEGTELAVYPDLLRDGLMFKRAKREVRETLATSRYRMNILLLPKS